MAEEKYNCKYNFNCEPGSNPTFIQDSVFHISGDFITTPVKKPKATNENSHVANCEIPSCLATDKAKGYWAQLRKAGFVDENCQRCEDVSRQTSMYIADSMADALELTYRWKPFEQLWNINHLAQEKKQMQDTGIMPQKYKEIDKIFNKE